MGTFKVHHCVKIPVVRDNMGRQEEGGEAVKQLLATPDVPPPYYLDEPHGRPGIAH